MASGAQNQLYVRPKRSLNGAGVNMQKVGHNSSINAAGAHSDAVWNRQGQILNRMGYPYPVFKSK